MTVYFTMTEGLQDWEQLDWLQSKPYLWNQQHDTRSHCHFLIGCLTNSSIKLIYLQHILCDIAGTNDAFVTIALSENKFQTTIKDKSIDPEWYEECDV